MADTSMFFAHAMPCHAMPCHAAYDIGSNTIGVATLNCSGAQAPIRTRNSRPKP